MDKISENTAYKLLNMPEQLMVLENSTVKPIRVGKGNLIVTDIEDKWRIDDEWWRIEPISRIYHSISLDNGMRMVIYKDLITGRWYRQTIGKEHVNQVNR
jgi:hypothetical protein